MTTQQLAQTLHNFDVRDGLYSGNMTQNDFLHEFVAAKAAGLVVAFVRGDDTVTLLGAIENEVGVYHKPAIYFVNGELLTEENFGHAILSIQQIDIQWNFEGYYGHLTTTMPHHSFDLLDRDLDNQRYCRGIVFDIKELKK